MEKTCDLRRPRRARHQQTLRSGVATWPIVREHLPAVYFIAAESESWDAQPASKGVRYGIRWNPDASYTFFVIVEDQLLSSPIRGSFAR